MPDLSIWKEKKQGRAAMAPRFRNREEAREMKITGTSMREAQR